MKRTTGLVQLILLALVSGCSSEKPKTGEAESKPAALGYGWKKAEGGAAFSFWVPEDLEQQRVTGIDSLVGEYRSAKMRVSFDYGVYSNPLTSYSDEPEYSVRSKTIGDKDATIVSFRQSRSASGYGYLAAAHFAEVRKSDEPGTPIKLTLQVEFNSKDDLETAERILESIVFK